MNAKRAKNVRVGDRVFLDARDYRAKDAKTGWIAWDWYTVTEVYYTGPRCVAICVQANNVNPNVDEERCSVFNDGHEDRLVEVAS